LAIVIALVAAFGAMAAFALPVWAANSAWTASMDPAQEVPPTATTGAGNGKVLLNKSEDSALVSINWWGVSSPVTAWHVHCPGPPGMDAPIVFDPASTVPGSNLKWMISPVDVGHLQAGNCYLNVHTTNHLGGEIRGQLVSGPVGGIGELAEAAGLPPSAGGTSLWSVAMLAALTAAIGFAAAGTVGAAWRLKGRLTR
jgi:hypothetical protein